MAPESITRATTNSFSELKFLEARHIPIYAIEQEATEWFQEKIAAY